MQKRIAALIFFALYLALPMTATAGDMQPGPYFGGGYMFVNYDESGVPDVDLGAGMLRWGYQIDKHFAAEARVGYGLDDDSVSVFEVDLREIAGAYFKAGIPTNIGLYPYAILGVTYGRIEVSGPIDGSGEFDETDFSYGAGLDYWVDPSFSLGLEYMVWIDKSGAEWSGFTLGLNFTF